MYVEVYEWATCWRGRAGALADGGEARVATDLIHGVKNNAPLCCEIGHCDHNDVLFMVVAFRGAEKSVRPLSERTAASTISLSLSLLLFVSIASYDEKSAAQGAKN